MQQATILIVGCGDVGSTLGQMLLNQGHKVFGLRRNINQLPQGIQGISADLTNLESLKAALADLDECHILVYSAAASSHDEAGYEAAYVTGVQNTLKALSPKPQHLFFTSSTGVYHQNNSDWVDENSPCEPKSFSGKIMLKGEQQVLSSEIPGTVVRFSGIYGPDRGYLISRVRGGDIAPAEPLHFSNRIHRDDCAGVLNFLIAKVLNGEAIDPCYLASDSNPVTMHEITTWIAKETKSQITSETVSRRAGSKRCSNKRIIEAGYRFKYPSYVDGYSELIDLDQESGDK
ncbi:SDR family oxidoreductase [Neptuniibacter sp. QD48_11]|uniref:SDR family oxidoreductase n=1 Tax=unclassified Neptuniibacter TaxID=2630693 RepID=UPI0039F4F715